MSRSSLEFAVALWLEHSGSVWKVVGSIPIWNSEFFLSSLSTQIILFIIYRSESNNVTSKV